jgi:hypothetical protein
MGTGPPGRHLPGAPGLRAELAARGYSPGTAALQLQLAAELSRGAEHHRRSDRRERP